MNSYGIQGKLIKWFENYLFKRRQKVINKNSWAHFAFWERITPRCLLLVDKGILLPLTENSMLSMLPVLEKNKISVISIWELSSPKMQNGMNI
jgi:hypothetical protein